MTTKEQYSSPRDFIDLLGALGTFALSLSAAVIMTAVEPVLEETFWVGSSRAYAEDFIGCDFSKKSSVYFRDTILEIAIAARIRGGCKSIFKGDRCSPLPGMFLLLWR